MRRKEEIKGLDKGKGEEIAIREENTRCLRAVMTGRLPTCDRAIIGDSHRAFDICRREVGLPKQRDRKNIYPSVTNKLSNGGFTVRRVLYRTGGACDILLLFTNRRELISQEDIPLYMLLRKHRRFLF